MGVAGKDKSSGAVPSRLTEVVMQRNSRQEKAGSRSPAAQSSSLSSVRMAGHSSYVLQMNSC